MVTTVRSVRTVQKTTEVLQIQFPIPEEDRCQCFRRSQIDVFPQDCPTPEIVPGWTLCGEGVSGQLPGGFRSTSAVDLNKLHFDQQMPGNTATRALGQKMSQESLSTVQQPGIAAQDERSLSLSHVADLADEELHT